MKYLPLIILSISPIPLQAQEKDLAQHIDNLDARALALEQQLNDQEDRSRRMSAFIVQAQSKLRDIRARRSLGRENIQLSDPIKFPDASSTPNDPNELPTAPPFPEQPKGKNDQIDSIIRGIVPTERKGYYIQSFGGFMIPEEFRLLVLDNGKPVTIADRANRYRPVKSRNGFSTGLLFGRDFGAFRMETEFSGRHSEIKSIDLFGYPGTPADPALSNTLVDGYTATYGGLINALYDIDLSSDVGLFFGLGAGVNAAKVKIENLRYRDTTFVYQIMSGLAWSITDRCSLRFLYKYFISSGSKKSHFNSSTELIHQQFESLGSHNIELGIQVDL